MKSRTKFIKVETAAFNLTERVCQQPSLVKRIETEELIGCFLLYTVTCNKPLYLQPHSEAVLKQAIQSDTHFLSSKSVMDYSLLVGLDDGGKLFVVGIIGKQSQKLCGCSFFKDFYLISKGCFVEDDLSSDRNFFFKL